jgi:hypothetical protein
MDYVLSNTGLNSYYRASEKYPVSIYGADFDKNGNYDAVPALYLPATIKDKTRKEFPGHGKDDLAKQMIETKVKFTNYQSYARADIHKYFRKGQLDSAIKLSANQLQSVYIENLGGGKFSMKPLPLAAQISCLFGMVAEDADGDGKLDLLINGNDFGVDVSIGRYDALNGLFLKGNGDGTFIPMTIQQSGIFIHGNGRAFCMLASAGRQPLFAASQNRDALKLYKLKNNFLTIAAPADAIAAELDLTNNKKRKVEFPRGSSFLSQSARAFIGNGMIRQVTWIDNQGKRTVEQIK